MQKEAGETKINNPKVIHRKAVGERNQVHFGKKHKIHNPGRVKNQAIKHKEIKAWAHVHTKETMTIWQRVSGNTGYK